MKYLYVVLALLLTSCTQAVAATDISWERPTERVNGDALYLYEISHYDVKAVCDNTVYDYQVDGALEGVTIDAVGHCMITVRVSDTTGLYSEWVEAIDVTIISPPKTVFNLRIGN